MMCQRMGRPPTSTMGFGRNSVSSRSRVPNPPHRITTFTFGRPRHRSAGVAQWCRLGQYSVSDNAHSIPYLEMEPMLPLVIGPGRVHGGSLDKLYIIEKTILIDYW